MIQVAQRRRDRLRHRVSTSRGTSASARPAGVQARASPMPGAPWHQAVIVIRRRRRARSATSAVVGEHPSLVGPRRRDRVRQRAVGATGGPAGQRERDARGSVREAGPRARVGARRPRARVRAARASASASSLEAQRPRAPPRGHRAAPSRGRSAREACRPRPSPRRGRRSVPDGFCRDRQRVVQRPRNGRRTLEQRASRAVPGTTTEARPLQPPTPRTAADASRGPTRPSRSSPGARRPPTARPPSTRARAAKNRAMPLAPAVEIGPPRHAGPTRASAGPAQARPPTSDQRDRSVGRARTSDAVGPPWRTRTGPGAGDGRRARDSAFSTGRAGSRGPPRRIRQGGGAWRRCPNARSSPRTLSPVEQHATSVPAAAASSRGDVERLERGLLVGDQRPAGGPLRPRLRDTRKQRLDRQAPVDAAALVARRGQR